MYVLRFATSFSVSYQALIKGNKVYEKRMDKALRLLKNDPFYPSLKSHKVNTRNFKTKWSSWITGDLRVIWDFDEAETGIIIVLVVAKHSGTHREYR